MSEPSMTQDAVVGWTAYCPETGGRCLEHTEHRAREKGQACYAPRRFVIQPLYAGELPRFGTAEK